MKTPKEKENAILEIPMIKIISSIVNPRKEFDGDSLKELAESIKERGLLQPIIVSPFKDVYKIVVGERRFRAMQLLKSETISAIIKEVDDTEARYLMLIENLQRQDLSDIEEGLVYVTMHEKLEKQFTEIGKQLGLPESTVRKKYDVVTRLSENVLLLLQEGKIGYGIAQDLCVLSQKDSEVLADMCVSKKFTREQLTNTIKNGREVEAYLDTEIKDPVLKLQLYDKYIDQKFDSETLNKIKAEVYYKHNPKADDALFHADFIALANKIKKFAQNYPNRTTVKETKLSDKEFEFVFTVKG